MPKKYTGEKDTSISHTPHLFFLKLFYFVAVDFLEGEGSLSYDDVKGITDLNNKIELF